MKRRIRRIVNFFAFNLLFFALYLNFVHKDRNNPVMQDHHVQSTAAVNGTVPVSQPEKYLGSKTAQSHTDNSTTANLSIN